MKNTYIMKRLVNMKNNSNILKDVLLSFERILKREGKSKHDTCAYRLSHIIGLPGLGRTSGRQDPVTG